MASLAAIVSLAVGTGAVLAAFQLVHALLLRPLPIAAPERLYALSYQQLDSNSGVINRRDNWQFPLFREMRSAAAASQAKLIALSGTERVEIELQGSQQFERRQLQYVSGDMFEVFGLRPAAGRLLSRNDDLHVGAHPVAVISHAFWSHRFSRDPHVLGRTFRLTDNLTGTRMYQIVGVAPDGFTGAEPGKAVDIFLPSVMHWAMAYPNWSPFRTFAHLHHRDAGTAVALRDRLGAVVRAWEESQGGGGSSRTPKTVELRSATAGLSVLQTSFGPSLAVLSGLAVVVLLIACGNVANLMRVRAMARSREMAIRVSLGASRWRLGRMVWIESVLIGFWGCFGGFWFAQWSIPYVLANLNPPEDPLFLSLAIDWRVGAFAVGLALVTPLLAGLSSILQVSMVRPSEAIRGGHTPTRSRSRWMNAAVATQTAFCFVALHAAALLVLSFHRLDREPKGFSPEGLVVFDIVNPANLPGSRWEEVANHVRGIPGVDSVAYADWPLLDGRSFKSDSILIHGLPPNDVAVSFMNVSPGWLDTMKIPFLAGRDFRTTDLSPGAAIVNESFVTRFFPPGAVSPLGQWFEGTSGWMRGYKFQIVGVVRDARYRDVRLSAPPVAYTPFRREDARGTMQGGVLVMRTSAPNPLALAATMRNDIPRIRPEFRVSNIRTQQAVLDAQTTRERLLAMLARYFGLVALILAGVGLYSVLNHSVLQRQREIGIRKALGARSRNVVASIAGHTFPMLVVGTLAGLALTAVSTRYIQALLYQVSPTELLVIAGPSGAMLAAAILAAAPAVVRALDIDPVSLLRTDAQ